MQRESKSILAILSLILIVMTILLFFSPIINSGYTTGGKFNLFWLWISDSGKATGTIALVSIVTAILTYRLRGTKQLTIRMLFFWLGFLLSLKGIAEFNEHFLKPFLGEPRPSFRQLSNRGIIDLNSFYVNFPSKEERRAHLNDRLQKVEIQKVLADIDPDILQHWVYETGYSMPSGHTQNAFILVVVLSYVMLRLRSQKINILVYGLMLWGLLMALSRTSLGVHTSLDVIAGAFSGALYGFLIIQTGLLDRVVPDNEEEAIDTQESVVMQ